MEDFWAPIVKDNVFFPEAVSPVMSNYVYEPSSSRPPSQFSVDNYYLCIDGDDGYNSGSAAAYIYESSSSTSPPSHISENGYLNNEEDYAAFASEYTGQPQPNNVQFVHDAENDLMPPIPPSRTRSKMHDLAVRHKLITDQNTRINGGMLVLSSEEKRTLVQEGYEPPTSLPLSREQEEALKIVRRKIKNKLSAQESRRKRKEYIESLEKKVHTYYNEALSLRSRLKQAELERRDLINQLKRFQASADVKDPSLLH